METNEVSVLTHTAEYDFRCLFMPYLTFPIVSSEDVE